jgi:hypothetical protein
MPRGSRKLPVVASVVYAAVVLVLLGLAVFARGFSVTVGEVGLTGRYVPFPLFATQKIRDLTLSFRGLELRLTRSLPLVIRNGDAEKRYFLDSLQTSPGSADILFEGGTRLHLAEEAGGTTTYTLAPSFPADNQPAFSLVIPYTLESRAQAVLDSQALSWSAGGRRYLLSIPSGSRIDPKAGTLLLAARPGTATDALRLESSEAPAAAPAAAAPENPLAVWLSRQASLATQADLDKAVSLFTDTAFSGWTQKRLSTDGRLWLSADGEYRFREEIGPAMIAESISRGAYPRARSLYADALASRQRVDPDAPYTLSACAFVGNTRDYMRRLKDRRDAAAAKTAKLLSASDPSLFTPGLVPLLFDDAQSSLLDGVYAFLKGRDVAGLEPGAALGMLEACLDYAALTPEGAAAARKGGEVIQRRLLPLLRKTSGGIFLEGKSGGRAEISDSMRCGALFMRAGEALGQPLFAALGRSLIVSSLGLLSGGFLPAQVAISQDSIGRRAGSLAPEDVYPFISRGRPYPREIPVARALGPGSWVMTAADLSPVESSPSGITMKLGFPVGLPHYIVVQGMKPFSLLRLHGIPWRPDPTYYQYTDGYSYDAQSRTLYMKITPRVLPEEFSVTFAQE